MTQAVGCMMVRPCRRPECAWCSSALNVRMIESAERVRLRRERLESVGVNLAEWCLVAERDYSGDMTEAYRRLFARATEAKEVCDHCGADEALTAVEGRSVCAKECARLVVVYGHPVGCFCREESVDAPIHSKLWEEFANSTNPRKRRRKSVPA